MAVEVESDRDAGVSEPLADNLRVDSRYESESCGRVPQVVETDPWQARRFDTPIEGVGKEARVGR